MDRSPARVRRERVTLDQGALTDLRDRLGRTRPAPQLDAGWELGAPRRWLEALLTDWQAYDAGQLQTRLDALTHLRVEAGSQTVHLVLAEGRGRDPLPLVLTHGWPSSFLEHLPLLDLLTDPGGHGGDPDDAFTVIIPSLPGFGFSSPPPPGGLTSRQVAALWHRVLTDGLGHRSYAAHGSDLGAGVTAWLARDHPHAVTGIHLATPGLAIPAGTDHGPAIDRFASDVAAWQAQHGGYAHEHATTPATLAAGLADSPAGLAAWIGEKVYAWSSPPSYDLTAERDFLLATLTLYWTTGTIGTSLLPYWASRNAPNNGSPPVDQVPAAPTAISLFGGERVPFPQPPRELAERYFNLTAWTTHDTGGHFPGVAEPRLLAEALRAAFRPSRSS